MHSDLTKGHHDTVLPGGVPTQPGRAQEPGPTCPRTRHGLPLVTPTARPRTPDGRRDGAEVQPQKVSRPTSPPHRVGRLGLRRLRSSTLGTSGMCPLCARHKHPLLAPTLYLPNLSSLGRSHPKVLGLAAQEVHVKHGAVQRRTQPRECSRAGPHDSHAGGGGCDHSHLAVGRKVSTASGRRRKGVPEEKRSEPDLQ